MKIETPFVALIIMSLLFFGLYSLYTNVADKQDYEVDYDTSAFSTQNGEIDVESAFNKINQTKQDMDTFTSDFSEVFVEKDTNLFSFFKIALLLGKQVYNSMNTVKDVFTVLIEMVGLPSEALQLFSIILVSFILLIVLILMGRSIVS